MDQLQQARAQIDEIDAKMAALFEQRMQAVGQVAQYKARTGKQVFDPAREALVLEKNTARVQNPELQPYYREFLKKALAVSPRVPACSDWAGCCRLPGGGGRVVPHCAASAVPLCQGTGVLHLERGGGSRGAGRCLLRRSAV